jgi:hypothetical protein
MQKNFIVILGAVIVGLVGGYLYGQSAGYTLGDAAGYERATKEVATLQESAADRATAAAAKEANPFQATNPLAGVETDPLAKAKSILNPFE